MSSGSRSTALGGGLKASIQSSSLHADKRKANELASSGDSNDPTNRRPVPGAGSATSSVTGELAVVASRHLGPPEGKGDVRGCIGRARRSVSAKWAAQPQSHGFGPVRTRSLNRDNQ